MKFPFEDLKVWQEGVDLAKEAYKMTYGVITLSKISLELKYLNSDDHKSMIDKCESIQSKLAGLINSLKGGK